MKKNLKDGAAGSGFTLIELLIVIAILGVLAAVVLVAINPVQMLARTRDAGRISTVAQVGHALEAFSTNHNGSLPAGGPNAVGACGPAASANWAQCLVDSGEIVVIPALVANTLNSTCSAATSFPQQGWCYNVAAPNAVIFSRLEATANINRCGAAGQSAFAVYSTANGRAGIVCTAIGEPVAGVQTFRP